jgi:hypothetical protein
MLSSVRDPPLLYEISTSDPQGTNGTVAGNDAPAPGLIDTTGKPIRITDVPPHKWLLVVYAAAWCAPCTKEAAALERYFSTSEHASDYVWVTLDVSRMLDAKAAVNAAKNWQGPAAHACADGGHRSDQCPAKMRRMIDSSPVMYYAEPCRYADV